VGPRARNREEMLWNSRAAELSSKFGKATFCQGA
jgi:hypothetical protein